MNTFGSYCILKKNWGTVLKYTDASGRPQAHWGGFHFTFQTEEIPLYSAGFLDAETKPKCQTGGREREGDRESERERSVSERWTEVQQWERCFNDGSSALSPPLISCK